METETKSTWQKAARVRTERAAQWCERHGISYAAAFVPFSQSRNAKPAPRVADLSINWRVTLTCGGRAVSCDYSQGIGHLPAAVCSPWPGASLARVSIAHEPIIRAAVETGHVTTESGYTRGSLKPPALADVLQSLALDSEALNAGCFENWAAEFGYDSDSRAAEHMYQECVRQALALRACIGARAFDEMAEVIKED